MSKSFRILTLILAVVMIFTAVSPSAFAYNSLDNDYTGAKIRPNSYMNGVGKFEFTVEEGAGYVLDLLDNLLRKANLKFENERVLDEEINLLIAHPHVTGDLTLSLDSIDNILYSLYTIIYGINNADETCITEVIDLHFGSVDLSAIINDVVRLLDLGDIERLNITALGNQRSSTRVCRNVPYHAGITSSSDIAVLKMLIKFLSDNRDILGKAFNSTLNFGTLDNAIKGIDSIGPYLKDMPGALKSLIYTKLFNSDAEKAPDNWNYDDGIQQLVNWALIDGTGSNGDDGGKSVLGSDFEAFLPAIAEYPGGADIKTQNVYHLVNNAINALLSGFVSDLIEDKLIEALDIDADANGGKGNTDIMTDAIFMTITGAIETLCTSNGAPAITYSEDAQSYPIPKIEELLDWFFNGGGLSTFINISYEGISITDNFVSLFNDIARLLPSLFPLFGFEVPEGLTYTDREMSEKEYDEYDRPIFLTFEGEEIVIPDPDNNPNSYIYLSDGTPVNTTNPGGSNYRNPKFIRNKYTISNEQVYGSLIKIILNQLIDGCYFPEWADTIPAVGAYALGSLAAYYLPENNYLDRLDKYHYEQIGETYAPRVASNSITSLAYTEDITIGNKTVTIPRAAMDIGFSLLAYLFNGWNDFSSIWGFSPETNTNFETYLFEFLIWGAGKYMPMLVGQWDSSSKTFQNIGDVSPAFKDVANQYVSDFINLRSQYPSTGTVQSTVCNIPPEEMRDIVYGFINDTIFEIIPIDWLPEWVGTNGSSGLFNDWLFDSIVNFDLQKLISLFSINPNGELAEKSLIGVVINLLDRVTGLVFGGHALLPSCYGGGSERDVLSTETSITSLEELLGNGNNLKSFGISLLYYLNIYADVLTRTIFPLLISGTIKDAEYYPTVDAAQMVDYISPEQITPAQLKNYIKQNQDSANSTVYYGTQYYSSSGKAAEVAEAIGIDNYNLYESIVTINGSKYYSVEFPEYYETTIQCRNASNYIPNSFVYSETVGGERIIQLYQTLDYRAGTATETVNNIYEDGVVVDKTYSYSNISRAMPAKNGDSFRTGNTGEVVYGNGFKAGGREDFRSPGVFYYNRFRNSIDDAEEFINDFDFYAHSTLPDAYGDWLMYFINSQLKTNHLYDKNSDGIIDENPTVTQDGNEVSNPAYDGYPAVPSSDYPFYAASGNSVSTAYYGGALVDTTYNFNYSDASNSLVVAEAIAYSNLIEEDGSNHNVKLSDSETESVVRYAISSIDFNITDGEWSALSAAQKSDVASACTALGLIYDQNENTIYRKAFALIPASLNGASSFGSYEGSSISLTPIPAFVPGGEDAAKLQNNIQEAYISFAENIKNYNDGLNNYYDNISWRNEMYESAVYPATNFNTLSFFLSYTANAYDSGLGRNKVRSMFGTLIPRYSKETYDEFQRAYEYGQQLISSNSPGTSITQSLVTAAAKAVIEAYKKLKPYDNIADWTQLDAYIATGNTILNGPLMTAEAISEGYGYSQESVDNLTAAVAAAEAFRASNYLDFGSEHQESIDEQATILIIVINSLEFPEGLEPGAVRNENYNGSINIVEDSEYNMLNDGRNYKIITGLSEGSIFDNTFVNSEDESDNIFIPTGYTSGISGNTFDSIRSSYGPGTGSYVVGKRNFVEVFKYYVVIFGDLNGDSRIDGVDRTIISRIVAEGTESENPKYIQIAADVNFDGVINADDAAIVEHWYKHEATEPIDQTHAVNAAWFDA